MGRGKYNSPVGLDRRLGPSAVPWSFPVIDGYYVNVWVNLWDFFTNLSRSRTVAWSISARSKYGFPHTFCRNVTYLSHWQRKCEALSIAIPHWLHDGSLYSPIMLKWRFRHVCPVKTPITSLSVCRGNLNRSLSLLRHLSFTILLSKYSICPWFS